MDLFTLAIAQNITGGGGGGSVDIPESLFQFSVFKYDRTQGKYVWESTPTENVDNAIVIPIYHDGSQYFLPCDIGTDNGIAHYMLVDNPYVYHLWIQISDEITVVQTTKQTFFEEIITSDNTNNGSD